MRSLCCTRGGHAKSLKLRCPVEFEASTTAVARGLWGGSRCGNSLTREQAIEKATALARTEIDKLDEHE
jgi:hypothetical protein